MKTPKETTQELYELYASELLRMCFLYLNDIYMAEDALHETFIKVFRNIDSFHNMSSAKTWIIRIAINTCKDILRRGRDTSFNIYENEAVTEDEYEKLYIVSAIQNLKPIYREAVILHYYDGLSYKEISKILHVPVTTISGRIKRAKQMLKNELKEDAFDE